MFSALADARGGVLLRLRGFSRWVSAGLGERGRGLGGGDRDRGCCRCGDG